MSHGTRKSTLPKTRAVPGVSPLIERLGNLEFSMSRVNQMGELDEQQVAEICGGLVGLARLARATGLSSYCSITLQVLEQLTSIIQTDYMPIKVMSVFRAWISLSIKYLVNPRYPGGLVENLGDRRWEHPVHKIHCDVLFGSLQHDWADVEWELTRRSLPNALTMFHTSASDATR